MLVSAARDTVCAADYTQVACRFHCCVGPAARPDAMWSAAGLRGRERALASTPSSTAYLSPSLRASTLSPAPFLGRSASSASLISTASFQHRPVSRVASPTRSMASLDSPDKSATGATRSLTSAKSQAELDREAAFNIDSRVPLQLAWSSTTRGDAVPWRTHRLHSGGRDGPLSLHRHVHPKWVAVAPGTRGASFERPVLGPLIKTPTKGLAWNSRFVLEHHLDGNPVRFDGVRKGLDNRTGVGFKGSRDPRGSDRYVFPPLP